MKNPIKKFLYIASVFAALLVAGCTDDIADEITELNLSRLLSPTDITAITVDQTSARLNWKGVPKAESYTIEFHENGELNFDGTPVRTVSDVTTNQLPVVIPGFSGETSYSVRVKAVGAGIAESKWVSTTFTTDAEQIFFPVNPLDIKATSVTLKWPAGEVATSITLNPGEITHTVTAEEITAGAAEITGLVGQTEYTAVLMNDGKVRGTVTFETLLDIGNAILVNPEDDLKSILEAADAGDAFALMPGDYPIAGDILITQSIEIIGALPTEKPVIQGAALRMLGGAGLKLKDLILDGATTPDGNQTVVYNEVIGAGEVYGDVAIENCVIKNYVKGVFYVNIAVLIESVTIRNTIYHDIECAGGDFIDFRNGMTRKFDFINNTVYNSSLGRDVFRMDAGGSTNFPAETSIILIQNNTFYNVVNVNNRRFLYVRLAQHEISVIKNIFAETLGNYSNQSATKVVAMTDNNYFNAPSLTSAEFTVHDAGTFTTLDPGFANPAEGDFTISNSELILFRIGDPRWLP